MASGRNKLIMSGLTENGGTKKWGRLKKVGGLKMASLSQDWNRNTPGSPASPKSYLKAVPMRQMRHISATKLFRTATKSVSFDSNSYLPFDTSEDRNEAKTDNLSHPCL